MFNRTIGRLCGFFLLDFGFWVLGFDCWTELRPAFFLFAPARAGLAGVPDDVWLSPPGRAGSSEVGVKILDCPPAKASLAGGAAAPPTTATKRSAHRQQSGAHFAYFISFLSDFTQLPSLRLPFRGSIPRPSPSSSIPHVCGTDRN